jgi:hypothetical protein
MTITDGLITLAEARASLGWAANQTADNDDLERYIEAATPVIENITGPVLVKQLTFAFNGGVESIVLPVPFSSVVSVTENGVAVTDYVADADKGIITAGTTTAPDIFEPGIDNIVVTVSVGSATIPPNVKLAARELVRYWWQQGRQANIPAFGDAPPPAPNDYWAIPRNVQQLLQPNKRVAGFA